jgi:hypothetical protein
MSRPPRTHTLTAELRTYRQQLDAATQQRWGVSGAVYRALDRLFNILVLGVTVFFVQYTDVEPVLAMVFAVVLIGGAEGLQTFIMNATDTDRAQGADD